MTKQHVVTDGFNFLYIDGEGFPRWRDEEYATVFKTYKEACDVVNGCGLNRDELKVVAVR